MACSERFELPPLGIEIRRTIQLSNGQVFHRTDSPDGQNRAPARFIRLLSRAKSACAKNQNSLVGSS